MKTTNPDICSKQFAIDNAGPDGVNAAAEAAKLNTPEVLATESKRCKDAAFKTGGVNTVANFMACDNVFMTAIRSWYANQPDKVVAEARVHTVLQGLLDGAKADEVADWKKNFPSKYDLYLRSGFPDRTSYIGDEEIWWYGKSGFIFTDSGRRFAGAYIP